jgi:chromosome partitioning protein
MRKIAVMNQKGGVGKTTSSVNLAAGLAQQGKRVCLIDLDPQAHASLHLGLEIVGDAPTIYQAFAGEKTLAQVRRLTCPNLWLVPANIDLAATEVELADTPGRELILRQTLDQMLAAEPYDYVIMDCPPSLGVLTINALSAAEEVFIPLQPHFLALHGLSKLLETTALVTRRLNRKLRVSGIMLCMYETNTRLAADVAGDLQAFLSESGSDAPWSQARIFESRIRRNIKLAEAPSYGKSIFDYAPKCPGAEDYGGLVTEVLAMEQAAMVSTISFQSVPLARAG